jgi:FAD/FMN-containing dehydrogenase
MRDYQDLLARLDGAVDPRTIVPPQDWGPFVNGLRCPPGLAFAVLAPRDVAELRLLVRLCVEAELPIVPQGANSGLVGAGVPDDSRRHVVLLTHRLRAIRQISIDDAVVVAEAGVRLSHLNSELALHGLQLGIDLGADPSIGGMVATNTGGSRMLRYGDMRRHILGLEVVMADASATLVSNLRLTRKDNSRLGWSQLVSGAGGALGIVTAAAIELDRTPQQCATMLVGLNDLARLPALVSRLRALLGEFLSACETMSKASMEVALRHNPSIRCPFQALPEHAVLFEVSSCLEPSVVDVDAILIDAAEKLFASADLGIGNALVVPPSAAWTLRHAISDSLKKEGEVIGLDISLPLGEFPPFRSQMAAILAADDPFLQLCDFGHCGDGGVHFNLVWPTGAGPADRAGVFREIRMRIYDAVVKRGGSFSAEHGLGPANAEAFEAFTPTEELRLTESLRRLFDPKQLLSRALPNRQVK